MIMTLEEYKKELQQHDWYYEFSDDHGVWQRGERASARLSRIAREGNEEFKKAYRYASEGRPINAS
jgi:hypothetical protein